MEWDTGGTRDGLARFPRCESQLPNRDRLRLAADGEIVSFNQTEPPELSTVDRFTTRDHWADLRKRGNVYDVPTVSLMDLLSRNGAPRTVDYLSIDTEGSEFEILSTFDFDTYRFSVITCEHNFTPSRSRIHALLTSHGYVRKFEQLSRMDDWYVSVK